MIARLVRDSFWRQRKRKAIVLSAVALGTAGATALANMALDVGDKVSRELRSFGANLVVRPAGGGSRLLVAGEDVTSLRPRAYLDDGDILKVKENFWKNNILAFAPLLDVRAAAGGRTILMRGTWLDREVALEDSLRIRTGMLHVSPFWQMRGAWPRPGGADGGGVVAEPPELLAGAVLARDLGVAAGDPLDVEVEGRSRRYRVSGIVTTGGEEDTALVAPLETVQAASGLEGKIDRILVSALTTPESAVSRRLGMDPRDLSPEEFESWSCTPFASSIAYELSRAVPGSEALPIRRVADSEGKVLGKIGGLMTLVALLTALGSALTVTSALTTGVLERRGEIGLLKALGASDAGVVALFLAEATVIGLAGGLIGGGAGLVLSRWITLSVFGVAGSAKLLALAVALVCALSITLAGSALPARHVASLRAAEALRK